MTDRLLVTLSVAEHEELVARVVARVLAERAPAPSREHLPARVTVAEAARVLCCHPRTVKRYVATGRLRTVRLATRGSSRVLIDRASMDALLKECSK